MPTDQAVFELSYNRPRDPIANNLTSSFTLENYDDGSGNVGVKITQMINLDPSAVEEVTTLTITAGVTNDLFAVTIAGDTYIYKQKAGDTADIVATELAKRADANPKVKATAAANVVTLTGVVAGETLAITDGGSTTPANMTIAETTAASGTAKYRKLSEVVLLPGVDNQKFYPMYTIKTGWFTGADPATEANQPVSTKTEKYLVSLDAIQTTEGVARA